MAKGWKDLLVWQKSHSLVLEIYKLTAGFPKNERFHIVDQVRRASTSVTANIVEGHSRYTKKDFHKFLIIARGSVEELRYFIFLCKDLKYITLDQYDNLDEKITEVSYLLNALIKSVRQK